MKKILFLFLIVAAIFIACNSEKPRVGVSKIVATYKLNDTTPKQIAVCLRVIQKSIKNDKIVVDTFWGFPIMVHDTISKKDSIAYYPIDKRRINWHVENKDVDSLLKGK